MGPARPDGDTPMRIGSITKVFCGATLASMVADGKVNSPTCCRIGLTGT
jgi:CubicO group peptidase (beta-lactamase class C family)